jgi:hypothetical protein
MNADSQSEADSPTFSGIAGLVLLTLVVLFASFLIGFGYGVVMLGRSHAIESFLNISFLTKLLILSFIVSAVFWARFWRQPRSGGIR